MLKALGKGDYSFYLGDKGVPDGATVDVGSGAQSGRGMGSGREDMMGGQQGQALEGEVAWCIFLPQVLSRSTICRCHSKFGRGRN